MSATVEESLRSRETLDKELGIKFVGLLTEEDYRVTKIHPLFCVSILSSCGVEDPVSSLVVDAKKKKKFLVGVDDNERGTKVGQETF